ncbi:VOC family protein [Polaribacter gochangensis]|uniref:VOC family protein n=1 Tax=Polaribacter gochangensis TaxID=3252903 RepID=UPI00390478CA
MNALFHLSLPCKGIESTKNFYINILGAKLGRNTNQWLDVDLYNHQITFTKSGDFNFAFKNYKFEGTILPSFHFGVILSKEIWSNLYEKLHASKTIFIEKTAFLKDKNGEHISFFVKDPNGYVVEFKHFIKQETIFS